MQFFTLQANEYSTISGAADHSLTVNLDHIVRIWETREGGGCFVLTDDLLYHVKADAFRRLMQVVRAR
jgi:hypothetical protein